MISNSYFRGPMMQSKSQIISGLKNKWPEISSLINQVSDEQFIAKPSPDVWSIAEELDHVIKSASAVSSAMKVNTLMLKWKFGKPNRPIRSYDEVKARYMEKLDSIKGQAVAPSSFRAEEGKIFDKVEMLNHWESTLNKLDQRVSKWSDKNLNKILLPHPLLGKLMVREILYFTHFHTEHHRQSLEKKVSV
jgi:hypothetical protein